MKNRIQQNLHFLRKSKHALLFIQTIPQLICRLFKSASPYNNCRTLEIQRNTKNCTPTKNQALIIVICNENVFIIQESINREVTVTPFFLPSVMTTIKNWPKSDQETALKEL